MASLFFPHQFTSSRFLIFRPNLPRKWINNLCFININNVNFCSNRFSYFTCCGSPCLHSSTSFSSPSHLSSPPFRSLLQPRFPHLRSALCSMTTPPQSSSSKTVTVMIKGRVQGVFYRNWTVENASQLGLKGWVRNRRDGSVEAVFSGDSDKVQEMEERCRRGPPAALVTGLQVFPCHEDPGTGFQRRPTV